MRHMKRTHWLLIAGLAGAIGLQLAGLNEWADAATPAFWGGLLGQVAVVLTAMFTDKPKPPAVG